MMSIDVLCSHLIMLMLYTLYVIDSETAMNAVGVVCGGIAKLYINNTCWLG